MSEVIKVCKKHGKLTVENTCSRKGKRGEIRIQCHECIKEGHKRSYLKNKEKFVARNLEYTRRRKDKIKEIRDRSRKKNRKKQNEFYRLKYKKEIEQLSDNYIKMILARYGNLKYKDIPQGLIQLKRYCLAIKRKIKEIENGYS